MAICPNRGCCVEMVDGACPRCNPGRYIATAPTAYPAPSVQDLAGAAEPATEAVAVQVALAKVADCEVRIGDLEEELDLLHRFVTNLAEKLGIKVTKGPAIEGADAAELPPAELPPAELPPDSE